MFQNLSERLSGAIQGLRGKARLTEEDVSNALRQIRIALLEADVALPVVQTFVKDVRARAVGLEKLQNVSPGQSLVKLVHDELVQIMGEHNEALDLQAQPPVIVLIAGLQGSGKTTTTAKLARRLIEQERKKVMVVSCDVYRPAAIQQLETLANQVGAEFFPSGSGDDPVKIAGKAASAARKQMIDVLLVDTAGRLHIDEAMMSEVRNIHGVLSPHETLFVVDSMTGQDAANTAQAFNQALELTGVILTKVDGDARGGAALSVRQITGKPIKFVGSGEKTDALDPFHPERVASRILGMGDVVSLVEEVQQKVDQDKAQKLAKKIQKGKGFDLEDFRSQLEQMQNLGGMGSLMDKLPGMSQVPDQLKSRVDDKHTVQMIAMINSMTPQERRFPDIIRGSRKRRIAAGSGTEIQAVNRLLKQHNQMKKMMKKFGKGGMKGMMRRLGGLQGGPGGMPPGRL
ncbi:MAG TPA: signal recognition particle protein [Xanthomonadales bacterium]|nr:signal recognition particle protein [Xanthomonadales bacterium]HMB61149.1 signal recognition particle protein [Xanthomonadales bacterium]